MATLQLDRIWVNRMDTGEAISAYSTGRERAHEMAGEVRTYAGGRQRSVTTAGLRGQFSFTLRQLTSTQIETLIAWIGLHVQVRDHRGQRFFGVFYGVTPTEYKEPTLWDATVELHTVTADEGV